MSKAGPDIALFGDEQRITPSANPLYALAQAQVGGLGAFGANPPELLIDFGLDETGEISQRILPAEIARFHRNGVGKTFLHDVRTRPIGLTMHRCRDGAKRREAPVVGFAATSNGRQECSKV